MAKSVVINKLGNRRFTMYWPATATDAQALADAVLDGEYEIYESKGVTGSETVSSDYQRVLVMGKEDATEKKLYLNFYMPATKGEDDVYAALTGKTFNGIKFDTVYVLRLEDVVITGSSSSGSGGGA